MTTQTRHIRSGVQDGKSPALFWVVATFIAMLFLTGGSSRVDEPLSILVAPASILICGVAALTLKAGHIRERLAPASMLAATFFVALGHVTPLPAAIIAPLHGTIEAEIYRVAGSGAFQPLTISPVQGLNTVFALTVPLAIFLASVQLDGTNLKKLLVPVVVLGMISGIIGLFQVVSSERSALYLYRVTNNGEAVGLFSNRNHAATLLALLFPMLAIYAGSNARTPDIERKSQIAVLVASIILLPLILVVGSRSGLLLALISLALSVGLYQKMSTKTKSGKMTFSRLRIPIIAVCVTLFMGATTYFFARAEAIGRLFQIGATEIGRKTFWDVATEPFFLYFPTGSGSGTFTQVFQLFEPVFILGPSYLNHAHNDYLETAITFGVPGLIVLIWFILWFGARMFALWQHMDGRRHTVAMARMAGIILILITAASAADYPLRTPIFMALFTLCVIWLTEAGVTSPVKGVITEQDEVGRHRA